MGPTKKETKQKNKKKKIKRKEMDAEEAEPKGFFLNFFSLLVSFLDLRKSDRRILSG